MDLAERAKIQFGLADDCIRSCTYLDRITRCRLANGSLPEFWEPLWGILYADSINSWCQLFGTKSNESHWSGFIKDFNLDDGTCVVPIFGPELITSYLRIEQRDWEIYHREVLNFRNKRTSHIDHNWTAGRFPDLEWALRVCALYRDWLADFFTAWPKTSSVTNVAVRSTDAIKIYSQQITEVLEASASKNFAHFRNRSET